MSTQTEEDRRSSRRQDEIRSLEQLIAAIAREELVRAFAARRVAVLAARETGSFLRTLDRSIRKLSLSTR